MFVVGTTVAVTVALDEAGERRKSVREICAWRGRSMLERTMRLTVVK